MKCLEISITNALQYLLQMHRYLHWTPLYSQSFLYVFSQILIWFRRFSVKTLCGTNVPKNVGIRCKCKGYCQHAFLRKNCNFDGNAKWKKAGATVGTIQDL